MIRWLWNWRGKGIDFRPNVRLYGVGIGLRFFGMTVAERPVPEASPALPPHLTAEAATDRAYAMKGRLGYEKHPDFRKGLAPSPPR